MNINNKEIAIYGTGEFARKFVENNPSIKVSYAFDSNKSKQDTIWNGIVIEDILKYREKIVRGDIIVIITSTFVNEISCYLNELELKEGIHFIIYDGKSLENSIRRSLIVNQFSVMHTINGITFTNFKVSETGFHVVGFSDLYVIKLETGIDPKKKNDIKKEIEIIRYLNENNVLSCPKMISEGVYNSYPYFIVERVKSYSRPFVPDLLFSLLEQKSFGVYQGDLKPSNLIFDGDICYLVDYDQAVIDEKFKEMSMAEFLTYIKQYGEENYGVDVFSMYPEYFDYGSFQTYLKEGALKIGHTSLLRKQVTTLETDGFYHTIKTKNVYLKGARDINEREKVLEKVDFRDQEKVLDIGCNMGLLSMYLAKRGCNVVGIDLDPYIVKAAQMISNVEQTNALFKNIDIDLIDVEEKFDTVLLFSVLQHFAELEKTTKKISALCNRIILELGIMELGVKPVNGEWKFTSKWNFKDKEELIEYLEKLFPNFKFFKDYGETDRNRFILELKKL